MGNVFTDGNKAKFLHVASLYFKLPMDFHGTIGDAFIDLGNYYNTCKANGKINTVQVTEWDENMTLGDFMQKNFDSFKTLYDNGNDTRCNSMTQIVGVENGVMTEITV